MVISKKAQVGLQVLPTHVNHLPAARKTVWPQCKPTPRSYFGCNSINKERSIAGFLAGSLMFFSCGDAQANEKIAEFATSGFLFKDTVQVLQLNDPEIDGVSIYYTDYNRSIQEKLSSDPFADPSQSSLACVASGEVVVKDIQAIRGPEGKEIFSEMKTFNLLQNKRTRIRRIVDEKANTAIYVAYSTRNTTSKDEGGVSSSRYRTSMCAVPISRVANGSN